MKRVRKGSGSCERNISSVNAKVIIDGQSGRGWKRNTEATPRPGFNQISGNSVWPSDGTRTGNWHESPSRRINSFAFGESERVPGRNPRKVVNDCDRGESWRIVAVSDTGIRDVSPRYCARGSTRVQLGRVPRQSDPLFPFGSSVSGTKSKIPAVFLLPSAGADTRPAGRVEGLLERGYKNRPADARWTFDFSPAYSVSARFPGFSAFLCYSRPAREFRFRSFRCVDRS